MEHWEGVYRDQAVEALPWFCEGLDPDVEEALRAEQIVTGRLLDLGTGPGTQAIELARRGFAVTGSDIAGQAIDGAQRRARDAGVAVTLVQDDILQTHLAGPFDVVLDRGCFHVLPPEARSTYVTNVAPLLVPGGFLLLKCFSFEQPGTWGPYRLHPDEIHANFGAAFNIHAIHRTVYQGTLDPWPMALFCTLQRIVSRTQVVSDSR